jgi:hypothetical protein
MTGRETAGIVVGTISIALNAYLLHLLSIDNAKSDLEAVEIKDQMTKMYRSFFHIATFCDNARDTFDGRTGRDVTFDLIRFIEKITGIVDEARIGIRSYCHEHMDGYIPNINIPL